MARQKTQNGQKCCDNRSPLKSTARKGHNFRCSMIITQIGRRRISLPYGTVSRTYFQLPKQVEDKHLQL